MSCDGTCNPATTSATQPTAAQTLALQQAMQRAAQLRNCELPGRILYFAIQPTTILAAADGESTTEDDPAAAGIDFITVQPWSSKTDLKLHAILVDGPVAADVAAVEFTHVWLDEDRDVRPRIKGSFQNSIVPGIMANCEDSLRCGLNLLNSACLEPCTFSNPYRIPINNTTSPSVALSDITIVVAVEHLPAAAG